ncbi:sigma-70 family RNA polymerase sigma factor (plasmid) [Latilactobacillus curvatus]|uniref:sigma-70 family RNA polymerase sigma factor n=1 Tax=Latilactobacillus curvatus TaxID=28038 RepID=UPI0024BA4886|nr:sigma-70 family RNA polymerase sigma factor [Latilactobacillus curvatus]WHQ77630.1 sigma-70 family RNA polymerase sigma factor [Latilactobacillus curvatus]WHQ78856.1 sigma-70 family RNA polymerase sigma factor [Latilactobacillus curvatus]WHQ79274.1 sigma-70 family RNA polymerase sigma factor [Latilactobacillus curvatus]
MSVKNKRFEWLKDYLDLDDEIRYLSWKIRKAKNEEARWTSGDLKNIKLEAGSKGAHVMDKVPEYENALRDCKAEQYDLLQLVNTFKGYENTILKLKYVDGMNMYDIADQVGYSYETVRTKHAELHRRLDFIDDWEDRKNELESRMDYDS